jgi:transposase
MSKIVKEVTLGIDVSKRHLEVFDGTTQQTSLIENNRSAIEAFVGTFSGPLCIAIEATSIFHEALVDQAVACGSTIYLVDGYKLSKYREAVGVRAKTDPRDAWLIHRYLVSERSHLRPLSAQSPLERQVWRLIKRRAKLVKIRTQLKLSLSDLTLQGTELNDTLASLNRLIYRLTTMANQLAKQLGWGESLARLRTIPGVGELNALALRVMYSRGTFTSVDRFIAFSGMDIRVRDSGTFTGRRKLTKKGDPEVRRLLFNGARSAAYRQSSWLEKKQQLMARGFSEIQTSVILSRKIARIAYALLKTGSTYKITPNTCIPS